MGWLTDLVGGKKPPPKKAASTQRSGATSKGIPASAKGSSSTAPMSSPGIEKTQVQNAIKTYSNYADIPKFVKLLTGKSGAGYPVSLPNAGDENNIVSMNLQGNSAIIVCTPNFIKSSTMQHVRSAIINAGYAINEIALANASLIQEIYTTEKGDKVPKDSRANTEFAKAIEEWVSYGVKHGATDIHLMIDGNSGVVKFRIHGDLVKMRTRNEGVYTGQFLHDCAASLYNNDQQSQSGSDSLYSRDKYVGCMIPISVNRENLKLRFQNIPGDAGPRITLRILHVDQTKPTSTFEELGYAPTHIDLWQQAMLTPSGAIIIAGITGSGKTTTFKSFIELHPALDQSAVYTGEDPVEYKIRGATQIPIQRSIGNEDESARAYNAAVGALMRGDPDIAGLGEIRDYDSANALQQIAESGHMSIGTTHAHLISGIVPRLINSKVRMSREILTGPNILTMLVYQALVPVLCPVCSYDSVEAANSNEITFLTNEWRKIGIPTHTMRWKREGGCPQCNHMGTIGLTVVAEMLMPDDVWLKHIRDGDDWAAFNHYLSFSDNKFHSPNMTGKTVYEHTLFKAINGQVDARQCNRFEGLHRFMARHTKRIQKLP